VVVVVVDGWGGGREGCPVHTHVHTQLRTDTCTHKPAHTCSRVQAKDTRFLDPNNEYVDGPLTGIEYLVAMSNVGDVLLYVQLQPLCCQFVFDGCTLHTPLPLVAK
jgi:hypothetical protein